MPVTIHAALPSFSVFYSEQRINHTAKEEPLYFEPDQIARMDNSMSELTEKCHELAEQFVNREYASQLADEHAKHGFCRRLNLLARAIHNVFRLLPPELTSVPDDEMVIDATINIQSFVTNVVGCCDNLAWIWVGEKAILQNDGSEVQPHMVGLRSNILIKTYPDTLRTYLEERREWLDYIKNFRDSLGHRIPLYIPPYIVDPENVDAFKSLEAAALKALSRGEMEEFERLETEQERLKFFRPWITHSFREESGKLIFHPQMLSDFDTIHEIGWKFFHELEQ